MKIKNISYDSIESLREELDLSVYTASRTFIQVFSGLIQKEELLEISAILKEKNSGIGFIGTTTAGEIIDGSTKQASITLSIMTFDTTTFISNHFTDEDNFNLGVKIAKELFVDNTKVAIMFIEGLLNNGNDVVDGIASVDNTIPIAGGMAGDNGAFAKTYVFDNNGVYEEGAVGVSFQSEHLKVLTNYQLNWQPIGKELKITKAEKNRLYEIDGISASEIYRKYLGDNIANELPHSAIEFPLLKIEDDGREVCRTFVHQFDDGSLLTIGNLEVGDTVQLAFGNVDLILNGVNEDIQNYDSFQPEAIFTYSCASRITFLQSDVVRELDPLNNIAPIAGYFTYGEIYHNDKKNSLLNISLTILGLSESLGQEKIVKTKQEERKEKNFTTGKHFMVLDALSHLSNSVINELNESKKEVENQQRFVQTLLDSQEQLIITTNGERLITANETFYDFFAVDSVEEFMEVYDAKCICDTFNVNAPEGYLQIRMGEEGREGWIDYVISRSFGETHKAMITQGDKDFIFSVTAAKLPGDDGLKSAVFTDITEMEKAKEEIELAHKHTKESIEYASLIQGALIPDNTAFTNYFSDYFTIWQPKDTVGGDIYLFEELRSKDECLLMVIDCTGHGVPGAFVTMLVKAIERQLTSYINNNDEIVSPAKLLGLFNRSMKHLLKQEESDSISNAGFDGGIVYFNKKDKILKFAGAETPLFYMEDGKLKTIKGNRHSVGYRSSDINYEFKEHSIELKEGMSFYLTTDGYLDQNGGEKSFPFGKKRFTKIIEENYKKSMADQQEVFLNELDAYQGKEETNDDVTLVGFKI